MPSIDHFSPSNLLDGMNQGSTSLYGWLQSIYDSGYRRVGPSREFGDHRIYIYQNEEIAKSLVLAVLSTGRWIAYYALTHGHGDYVRTEGDACNE